MDELEAVSDKKKCYFVDLFVRVSNKVAIGMYEKLGYTIYRCISSLVYSRYGSSALNVH